MIFKNNDIEIEDLFMPFFKADKTISLKINFSFKNTISIFKYTFLAINLFACIANAGEIPSAAITTPLPAKPGTKFVTPNMLLEIANYDYDNEASVSWLDNNNILYSFPNRKPNEKPKIWVYNLAQKKSSQLTEGRFPHVSPDARWIAFEKGEGASKQLWVMDRKNNNHISQLKHVKGGLGPYGESCNFIWVADSKKLILSHQGFSEPWEKKTPTKTQIEEIDPSSTHSQMLTSVDGAVRYMEYLPLSKELLFVKERMGFLYKESKDKEWIQVLNASNHIRTLAEFNGLQHYLDPEVSPDGKLISILYDADHPAFNYMLSVGLVSIDANTSLKPTFIKQLTHEIQIYSSRWMSDAKLIILRQYGAYKQLYQIDISSGKLTQLTNNPFNIKRFELSPNKSQIVYFSEDAHGNNELQIVNIDGSNNHELIKDASVPDDVALSEVREIEWKTKDYPANMRGILIMPLHYKKGHRYPLIVDIHGGGVGAHLFLAGSIFGITPLEWQMWAAKGFAVFVPEFRSSGSFGSLAITRDLYEKHQILDGDLKDIDSGVDFLIGSGIVNPKKLAILGHSAGGNRANWFLVSTHRYQTIISFEGWADELANALYYEPSRKDPAYGGSAQEVPLNYIKNSSLYFVDKATTPTLFIMGNPKLGGVDPTNSVFKLHQAIKKKGIDSEYIKYTDEGHILEKYKNKNDALNRIIKWLDRYLN